MHEATRRVLGVLLRHLDGFDSSKRTVVIGATNRKQARADLPAPATSEHRMPLCHVPGVGPALPVT
jgi:hypothetical protein